MFVYFLKFQFLKRMFIKFFKACRVWYKAVWIYYITYISITQKFNKVE